MTLVFHEEVGGQILIVQASGTLSKDDYWRRFQNTDQTTFAWQRQ
jgi:hypothetical protein